MKIVTKNLSKSFGPVIALKDVHLTIEEGEFVVLVGPSGSGKTTFLKLLLHQLIPSSGEITISNINLNSANSKTIEKIRQSIGVVFQDYQLIPDKTIIENIELALDINSVPSSEYKSRTSSVLDLLGLKDRGEMFPSQLSGGELQRASLARALAIKPKLILADEPTGNLDPENTKNLVEIFKKVNQTTKTTIILTTHNQEVMRSLPARILNLNKGLVEDVTKNHVSHLTVKQIKNKK